MATWRPTSSEPVKEMTFGTGCVEKRVADLGDVGDDDVEQTGRQARVLEDLGDQGAAAIGVFWCGLSTTPLPSASAGATDFSDSRKGKLKGLMTPTTPTGTR